MQSGHLSNFLLIFLFLFIRQTADESAKFILIQKRVRVHTKPLADFESNITTGIFSIHISKYDYNVAIGSHRTSSIAKSVNRQARASHNQIYCEDKSHAERLIVIKTCESESICNVMLS